GCSWKLCSPVVTLIICPKPDHTWTPDSHLAPPTTFSLPAPHPHPLRPTPEDSLAHLTPPSRSLDPPTPP
ncbi:hypothetical protein DBR06_SOUSAS6910004, partial [Sousa chinensis]